MQGLYLANWDLDEAASGVVKKINNQVCMFRDKLGEVYTVGKNDLELAPLQQKKAKLLSFCRLGGTYKSDRLYEQLSRDETTLSKLDYLYIRKALITPTALGAMKKIKETNPKLKILMEIPTYPYDREVRWFDCMALVMDRKARKGFAGVVDRIVTFSNDEEIFGVPTIRISNGVNYDTIQLRTPKQHEGINLLTVALFSPWHGYDRVIEGMHKDFDIVKENNIKLHFVGKGRVLEEYKKKAEAYSLDEYVVFHGPQYGEALDKLYDEADIALDAIGRHRCNVFYNSTLKGKEYCAKGLPSVSGVRTELDSVDDAFYYERVPADDSPVSMKQIVAFYHKLYDTRNAAELGEDIRNATKPMFTFETVMRPIIDYLKS